MQKPKLYRTDRTINGVTVVLTPEAHAAFEGIASHFTRYGDYATMDATLWTTVAHGTFTFILDSDYQMKAYAATVYTGGYGLLDETAKLFEMWPIQTKHTFPLPFASGDLELFGELAKQGWGPKTKIFLQMMEEVKAVLVS